MSVDERRKKFVECAVCGGWVYVIDFTWRFQVVGIRHFQHCPGSLLLTCTRIL